jgi:hypothetical protein
VPRAKEKLLGLPKEKASEDPFLLFKAKLSTRGVDIMAFFEA